MNMHHQGGVVIGSVKLNVGMGTRSYLIHPMQRENVLGEIDPNKHNDHGPLPSRVS